MELPGSWSSLLPTENPFFSGGLGLALIGVVAQTGRRALSLVSVLARRHLVMTLEVTSRDLSYPWVLAWLSRQGRRTQHLTVSTRQHHTNDGAVRFSFDKVPGPGRHIFYNKGRWMWVERERQHGTVAFDNGQPWEKVVLTCLGRDVFVFDELLDEARRQSVQDHDGQTVIYTSWGTEWRPFGHPRRKRSLSSVVLAEGVAERLVADVDEWRRSEPWYVSQGIPYRRGYLLYGPPGGGKTSLIRALAAHLNYHICVLGLADSDLTDDRLALACSNIPKHSILLLEDVDAAFVGRTPNSDSRGQVTFSGLLNTLDGVASSEERLVFMTTNHIDRLDPALMRPGRVDVSQYICASSTSQAQRLFAKFYADYPEAAALADQFAAEVDAVTERDGTVISMAALQGYLMQFKAAPADAVRNVQHLCAAGAVSDSAKTSSAPSSSSADVPPRRPRRRLTAFDLDRMVFNPQPGSGFEPGA